MLHDPALVVGTNYLGGYYEKSFSPAGNGQRKVRVLHELTRRYMEPHRRYHTMRHVMKMFDTAAFLGMELDDAQLWAIWCHDVVYKIPASPGDNEDESAEFCAYYMEEAGLSNEEVARAQRMIRATAYVLGDRIPDIDQEQWMIVGLDLYGFGDRCSYESSAILLREEFGHLTDAQWNRYRTELLNKLRNRPYIVYPTFFGNEPNYHAWHQRAWGNIDRELQELE